MAQTHFSLSWEGYKRNICGGLSALQQNAELVDMTLAADGHFVKVHQVVMALASPFIKELITSTHCQHPIIFLNKISYTTLCYVLEYIYTGEVLVTMDNLKELIQAGQELHIKGLEDMNLPQSLPTGQNYSSNSQSIQSEKDIDNEICYFEITNPGDNKNDGSDFMDKSDMYEDNDRESSHENMEDAYDDTMQGIEDDRNSIVMKEDITSYSEKFDNSSDNCSLIQYTVSNQGSLQMILNRFIYYLKHTNRNNSRQWRCVDYLSNLKCPAVVGTNNDIVTQRIAIHNHPFHDKRILKKAQAGAIFTAIQEAERKGSTKKVVKSVADETNQGDTE